MDLLGKGICRNGIFVESGFVESGFVARCFGEDNILDLKADSFEEFEYGRQLI